MGIIPCEIPLLEFDPEQTAVIGPDYEQLDLHLPRKCVFAFLGGYIDRYAHAAGARQVATFRSATWGMLLYTADSLADVQRYDQRHWGGSAYEYALTLCLDAVLTL
ncbi:hypothetical protein [Vescimonas sp.]|uniref:hypothetical protein n=1 Tax=Vescimonas sp. TaxID=2892404 RepID=UPI003077FFA2